MCKKQYIHVRAKTKAKRETIEMKKEKFFISVKEKAERGEANKKIKLLLARKMHCNLKRLRLVKGATSTSKTYLLVNTK